VIQALDHVVVAAPALDPAIACYEILLGRAAVGRARCDGVDRAWFRLANMTLCLAAPAGTGAAADRLRQNLQDREGLFALTFAVSDLDRAKRLLERRAVLLAPDELVTAIAPDGATGHTLLAAPHATHSVPIAFVERAEAAAIAIDPLDAGPCVSGLDHVVIRSPDPDRAVALYGGRLGLDLRLDRSNSAWNARLLFFRCGDLVVEIAHDLNAGLSQGPDQLWGLSWRVPRVSDARTRLAAAGVSVSELRTGRRPGTQVFTVRSHTAGVPTLVIGPADIPRSGA
jgi:catechol 2,3-dioxygenase-like lactoylglutathione lyase family enzyme